MQIADGVYFVEGRDDMIPDCHLYVIGRPESGDLTLVDAGLVGKGDYKLDALRRLGIRESDVRRIIMTHTHLDHIGCASEILSRLPQAEFWLHRDEAVPIEQGDERIVYGMEAFRSMCQAQYGLNPGAFSFRVDRRLEGEETLEIGDMHWEVLHVPGHSPGSIALFDPSTGVLIPGDLIYSDHMIGRFDLHLADGQQLKESLFSLAKLDVHVLLPGHNRILEDVQPGYIEETAKAWAPYLG